MIFYVPINLDLKQLIFKHLILSKELKVTEGKIAFICHSLFSSIIMHRSEIEDSDNPYVPLCSKILDLAVHDYSKSLQFLLETGIIESDNSYLAGDKCKGYCFKNPYRDREFKKVYIEDFRLKKGLKRLKDHYQRENKRMMRGYGFLEKPWRTNKLKIDAKGAYRWIDENITKDVHNSILKRSVDSLWGREYRLRFSGDGHRHYSLLTNLKRELRNFLTYDGKEMVSIDIKNCQPFLVLALFKESFWENRDDMLSNNQCLKRLNPQIFAQITDNVIDGITGNIIDAIIMLLKSSVSRYGKEASLKKYEDLVVKGKLYEHIQEHFCQIYPDRFDNRDNTKREFLRLMNVDPKVENQPFYKPCQTFDQHFPEVYQLFRLIKSTNYTILPIILQRIESYLLIDVICKRISDLEPQIPIFTIHDSILTTRGNEGFIEDIITDEFTKWIGYPPKLDIKHLTPENLLQDGMEEFTPLGPFDFSKVKAA